MRSLVICDLDKTLIKVNTSYRFGQHLRKIGHLSSFKTALLIIYYARHTLGLDCARVVHKKSFELFFKGQSVHFYDELVQAFSKQLVQNHTNPQVSAFIEEKRHQGARLCLLSTGPELIVKHFGNLFGFESSHGTNYLCDQNGLFSGVGTVIDGSLKAKIAIGWMQEENYDKTYALTDSIHDLAMLEVVSDPIVVNPDYRLRREAKARGFTELVYQGIDRYQRKNP